MPGCFAQPFGYRDCLAEVRSCWLVRPGHALIVSERSALAAISAHSAGSY